MSSDPHLPELASADAARPLLGAWRLRDADGRLGTELSMGMTDDFEVAIEEGATIVRVGRALFGERPHDHGHGPHVHAGGSLAHG